MDELTDYEREQMAAFAQMEAAETAHRQANQTQTQTVKSPQQIRTPNADVEQSPSIQGLLYYGEDNHVPPQRPINNSQSQALPMSQAEAPDIEMAQIGRGGQRDPRQDRLHEVVGALDEVAPERAVSREDQKEQMVKKMAIVIVIDTLVLAVIAAMVFPRSEVTKQCSKELYDAAIAICIYTLFFVLRNIFVCMVSCYSKQPLYNSTLMRIAFICIDCIAYTAVVIWATVQTSSESAVACRNSDEGINELWWVVMGLIIYGFIQIFFEWLVCLVSSCLVCFFCCFYFAARSEQRAQAMARFQAHAPMLSRALNSLNPTKFKDLSEKAKSADACVICFEKFGESDDVHQLGCDERHVFHMQCLKSWMNSDTTQNTLQCPVCRKDVVQPEET